MGQTDKIETIIFDWAGVFCSPAEPFSHPIFAGVGGIDVVSEQTYELQQKYYRGHVTPRQFWRAIIRRYKFKGITRRELGRAYIRSSTLWPEMLDLARQLKCKYKIFLCSNATIGIACRIREIYSLQCRFDDYFLSNELGIMKPDVEIYQHIIQKTGICPAQTLFVDDSPRNLTAAAAIGFQVFLFEDYPKSMDELKGKVLCNRQ